MPYKAQIDERGVIARYKDTDTGEVISAKEFERRLMMQHGNYTFTPDTPMPVMQAASDPYAGQHHTASPYSAGPAPMYYQGQPTHPGQAAPMPVAPLAAPIPSHDTNNPLVQPGAQMLHGQGQPAATSAPVVAPTGTESTHQQKNLRLEGNPNRPLHNTAAGYKSHGFLDATSIAILLPTLVLLALIIAAAHKKRLFPWQTIRTFNPPSGLMSPRDYERSFVCPPNLRRHGRMGKRNPQATWTDADGIVIPFGFLARTHLPITIPLGRLPNKNMFLVAPSGSGKTTLMRAIMKALLAKPCVMIALEAKANDPNLDERKEGFKYTILPEAAAAGFDTLYFNPLDAESIHWNPLDLDATSFASSIVQDVNSLPPEEQHWAERDHGYIAGLVKLLKWGAVMLVAENENGEAAEVKTLPCNPRGLMRLVNNRRNIVESLRRLKSNPDVDPADLNELTLTLSSIIRTDTDWDKNIQGVRGRLRMFKNEGVLRVTEQSNIDMRSSMHRPSVLIFGAPASLGPDAESLASCFVYQLQQALHTRYGTASVLPLFAFFDEYQTLNIDLAGRLSAIVRGANGGLAVILQNISQIAKNTTSADPANSGASELKTIFSNSAIRVCLHNADETTARFFAEEIGKQAVIVPGISDHYESNGFGIFPTSWNRIHSQQVVARVDSDSIKRMEKHHALVYLSPAGDPEFGEAKPFMCDLRGIEEIARLHLLHNVSSRPQGPEQEGPLPQGGMPQDMSVPQAVLSTSAAIIPPRSPMAPASGHVQTTSPQMQSAPMAHTPALTQPINSFAPQGQVGPAIGPVTGPVTGPAPCPHCGKPPGKGRFCIECGKFIGQTQGSPTVPMSSDQAGSNPAAATAQSLVDNRPAFPFGSPGANSQSGAAQAQRQPVTTLHADLSKFGVPAQGQGPGQQIDNPPLTQQQQQSVQRPPMPPMTQSPAAGYPAPPTMPPANGQPPLQPPRPPHPGQQPHRPPTGVEF